MSVYLVAVDNRGVVVEGEVALQRTLVNPLRSNANTAKPIQLNDYSLDADLATSMGTGGPEVGAFTPGELAVSLIEDATTAVFFRSSYRGTPFRSVDVLLTKQTDRGEAVWFGIGVGSALVSSIGFAGDADVPRRNMTFTGRVFSVGSAAQGPTGALGPFAISTYDVVRASGT